MSRKLTTTLLAFGILVFLSSCDREREGSFTGIYVTGFEASDFLPNDIDERWWITPIDSSFDELNKDYLKKIEDLGAPYAIPLTYKITAIGSVSKKGSHGHLGGSEREFKVTKLSHYEWIQPAN